MLLGQTVLSIHPIRDPCPKSHRRRFERPALRFAATPPNRFILFGFFTCTGFPFDILHASLRDNIRPEVETLLGAEMSISMPPVRGQHLQ